MPTIQITTACRIFADALLGPEHAAAFLGGGDAGHGDIPISESDAAAAQRAGQLLVYRPARMPNGEPLTLAALHTHCVALKDDTARFESAEPWFLKDPFARIEAPEAGWALVASEPWPGTLSRTYPDGTAALTADAGGKPWRRRRAVEAALDCLLFMKCRQKRLLADRYDWSSTPSADGGLVTVGAFDEAGLHVIAYSPPVQYGALGVCPTLVLGR